LEIFTSKPELTGDDILNFMQEKGYLKILHKLGGKINYSKFYK